MVPQLDTVLGAISYYICSCNQTPAHAQHKCGLDSNARDKEEPMGELIRYKLSLFHGRCYDNTYICCAFPVLVAARKVQVDATSSGSTNQIRVLVLLDFIVI